MPEGANPGTNSLSASDVRLHQMLNDPNCNKECLGLCLSFFPSEAGVQKCGCQQAFTIATMLEQSSSNFVGEKFFQNSIDLSMVNPIMQEYKSQLRAIDFEILSSGLAHPTMLAANETTKE